MMEVRGRAVGLVQWPEDEAERLHPFEEARGGHHDVFALEAGNDRGRPGQPRAF